MGSSKNTDQIYSIKDILNGKNIPGKVTSYSLSAHQGLVLDMEGGVGGTQAPPNTAKG